MSDLTAKRSARGLAAWKWLLLPLMSAVILMAYLWAGELSYFQSPKTTRIIFWHVPMAMVSMVWFTAAAVYSIRYLIRHGSDPFDDRRAAAAAEVGLLLSVLATVTGAIFSKMQWAGGANSPWYEGYWQWDPKQTSILILIFMLAAYFGLRMSIEEDGLRARLSAVYAVIIAVAVPFLYYILPNLPIFGSSLHPNNVVRGGMDVPYRTTFWLANLGFLGITWWAYEMRLRLGRLDENRGSLELELDSPVRTEAVREPVGSSK